MTEVTARNPLEILQSVPSTDHGRDMSAVQDFVFCLNQNNDGKFSPELHAAFERAILDVTEDNYDAVKTVKEFVQSEVDNGRCSELLGSLGRNTF